MPRPLDGVPIIDWTIWQQGPVSTIRDWGETETTKKE